MGYTTNDLYPGNRCPPWIKNAVPQLGDLRTIHGSVGGVADVEINRKTVDKG